MIDKAGESNAVKKAAVKDYGWDAGDVQVSAVNKLDRDHCSFFRATNTAQKDRAPAEYVVLPNGEVAGSKKAAAVLKACGRGAPAEWWAQVVTRLSGEVRGVVVDPQHAPSALRKIRAAGGEWSPPELRSTTSSTTVSFYTIQYEEGVPYAVSAALSNKGALTVESRKLVAPAPGSK